MLDEINETPTKLNMTMMIVRWMQKATDLTTDFNILVKGDVDPSTLISGS